MRTTIESLADQQSFDEVFRASGKQLRPNKNGNLYLQVELSDKTGKITARLWNAGEAVYEKFQDGDYVQVQGTAQLFQGAMQIIIKKIENVDPSSINEEDFLRVSKVDTTKLFKELRELAANISDAAIAALVEAFLMDEQFTEAFCKAPAGVRNHHDHPGGLLQHTVAVTRLAVKFAPLYPQIDASLLIAGAILHDIGKTRELTCEPELAYTNEGQLLGHIMLGVEMIGAKIPEAQHLLGEEFPEETAMLLRHLLISHHGEYEFGSPCLPMCLEAVALHFLDNLDSTVDAYDKLLSEDPNKANLWTHYHPNIRRKLYKGASSD